MFTLPADLAAPLTEEVAAYIPTFSPQRLLTDSQWRRCDIAVWTSCAKTLPTSREDAKTQMSVMCAFLAYTDKALGSVDLDVVLTDDLINRFTVNTDGDVAHDTRASRQGRLRRALRAASGESPRTVRSARPAGPAPYSEAEMQALNAAASGSAALANAIAAIGSTDDGSTEQMASTDGADNETTDEWREARRAADDAGVTLDRPRLRATCLQRELDVPRPLVATLAVLRLTRRDLDNVSPYLRRVSAELTRDLLRG